MYVSPTLSQSLGAHDMMAGYELSPGSVILAGFNTEWWKYNAIQMADKIPSLNIFFLS